MGRLSEQGIFHPNNGVPMVRGNLYCWRVNIAGRDRHSYEITVGRVFRMLTVTYYEEQKKIHIGTFTDEGMQGTMVFFCDNIDAAENFVTMLSLGEDLPVMPLYMWR